VARLGLGAGSKSKRKEWREQVQRGGKNSRRNPDRGRKWLEAAAHYGKRSSAFEKERGLDRGNIKDRRRRRVEHTAFGGDGGSGGREGKLIKKNLLRPVKSRFEKLEIRREGKRGAYVKGKRTLRKRRSLPGGAREGRSGRRSAVEGSIKRARRDSQ